MNISTVEQNLFELIIKSNFLTELKGGSTKCEINIKQLKKISEFIEKNSLLIRESILELKSPKIINLLMSVYIIWLEIKSFHNNKVDQFKIINYDKNKDIINENFEIFQRLSGAFEKYTLEILYEELFVNI